MNAAVAPAGFYLARFLEPLVPYLDQEDITDLYINRPNEIWIERLSGPIARTEVAGLGWRELERLARQMAAFSHQAISRAHPLMAATLPDGSRVQVVLPPATRGDISLSVRRHVIADRSLSDYAREHAFRSALGQDAAARDRELFDLHREGRVADLLALAVRQRRNILVSGGTASGKTTFLNALLREIPAEERLITIEDTPELRLRHDNAVGLIAVRGDQGEAQVSADDLLIASMRMRPDRIILGELRGPEALTFLRSVNTGHPGSMTTIHADTPERAVDQLTLLVLQGGGRLRRDDIRDYVASVIDIYVQLERLGGERRISEVKLADHIRDRRAEILDA